jgi:Double zinc ribbon
MTGALVLGTILALAVLAFVLAPVVLGVKRNSIAHSALRTPHSPDFAITALREIEFDRATGKLSDADYSSLRERYANEALTAMRSSSPSAPVTSDDAVEAAVRAYRAAHATCAKCGIRPEADARYCSNCGGFLPGKCDSCGTAVTASGIRYCIDCGHRLAA